VALVAALRADDPKAIADPAARQFRSFADAVKGDRVALAAQAAVVHQSPIALDRIGAPTLLLVGDADPLAARPEVLQAAIRGARLERVRGDHMAALSDPRFGDELVRFLADG